MNLRLILLVASLALTATFGVRADNFLDIEGGEATSVGIYIRELNTGQVVVNHNAQLALTPASVTKAITSATALAMLGPDFQFTTRVYLTGSRSASAKAKWDGNLVINASGDPTTGSKQFKTTAAFTDSIIAGLRRLGVSSIGGAVIIRESMPDQGPVAQWEIEDLAWPYGAGLFGFNWAGNTVDIYPVTGKSRPASNLKVTLRPSADGDGTDLLRGVNSNNLTVWGSAKSRKNKAWAVEVSIPDPAEVYAAILTTRLRTAGISIGSSKAKTTSDNTTDVYTHRSPALTAICRSLMKRSDNLFAEGMLRALKPGATRADCLEAELDFWTDRGLNTKHLMLRDGSGLTRSNRIPPIFLADVLDRMIKSDNAQDYINFFPVSGVDGTLKTFLAKTPLKGRLALKTGSMASVQTYAGYKLDAEGHPTHVVVIMVNGFFCSRASLRKQIEAFLLKTFVNTPKTEE